MKLPKSIQLKETLKLFSNKYKYKIVLVCPAAGWFRGNRLDFVLEKLNEGNFPPWFKSKSPDDIAYCYKLQSLMSSLTDYEIRIESPRINFYTNNPSNIEKLANLDEHRVKFICLPSKNSPSLTENSVIVKNIDYNYRVYLGYTKQEYSSFINWIDANPGKIRITKSARRDLLKNRTWGGSYFYVKDDKSLTVVRMFLGSVISKIENVIKA